METDAWPTADGAGGHSGPGLKLALSMARTPESDLEGIEAAGLFRRRRVIDSAQGPRVLSGGRWLHNFASNDYLGLATHPALMEAAASAARDYGFGSGASRLVCGTLRPHVDLEEHLAEFKGTEAALAFGSGFAVGSGIIPAVVGQGDYVVLDKLSHACLVDGARASGATLRVFPHNRMDHLERLLSGIRAKSKDVRILVVTEAVFSMDGDLADLEKLVELKEAFDAILLVDEAHSTGIFGPGGRGLSAALGLGARIDLQMGTLSKALGCHGGYVAAKRVWVDLIYNRARSFIFATAPPPPVAAAALAAIGLCTSTAGDERRRRLESNRQQLANALQLPASSPSPIRPWIVGDAKKAMEVSTLFEEDGILVPAIRFPTVAKGSARLRFAVSSAQGADAFEALGRACTRINTGPGWPR